MEVLLQSPASLTIERVSTKKKYHILVPYDSCVPFSETKVTAIHLVR